MWARDLLSIHPQWPSTRCLLSGHFELSLSPPAPLCLGATLCVDSTIKKRSSKETWNEKPGRAVTCRREINPQPAVPASDPQDQLTHVCTLTCAYSHPSVPPPSQHHPSPRFSTHINKPRRPCSLGLAHSDLPPFTFLKLRASLSLFTFQIFHNFMYSIP